jgi:heme/copper-type cytochrome/quinol oxidase subunit 2
MKAGEQLRSAYGTSSQPWNRDGSIHGFTLLRAKDRSAVEGWDPSWHAGIRASPPEPGEYEAVCTVICSEDHEGMHLKVTVLP